MLVPVLGADSSEQTKPIIIFFVSLSWVFFPHYWCCKDGLSYTLSAYLKLEKTAGGQQEV